MTDDETTCPEDFDTNQFRQVLGHYPTGVSIVTARQPSGEPVGMAVGSFTSVSLDPPLVAFFADKGSTTFPQIEAAGSFCVNVLGAHQEHTCRSFSRRGHDRFGGIRWRPSATGLPILEDVVAWIECDIESVQEAGDHYLAIGKVRALDTASPSLPLMFFRGGYGEFSSHSLVVAEEPGLARLVRFSSIARPELERLASELGTECTVSANVNSNLVVLASAGSSGSDSGPPTVGRRIPMLPPLGTQFMAWEDDAAIEAWLARSPVPVDDARRAGYQDSLTKVRDRGWLAYRPDTGFAEIDKFSRRTYSEGAGGAASSAFEKVVAQLDPGFDVLALDGVDEVAVCRVIAAVIGQDGRACLAINAHLTGEPRAAVGTEYVRDRVVEAAARVGAAIRRAGRRQDRG
jgi:flavin reductase (DIM6/NTAB) family NADH-FMN oxidoreductase RutF